MALLSVTSPEYEPIEVLAASAMRLKAARNYKTGGANVARQHIHDITEGRCAFTCSNPARFREFGAAEVRFESTSIRLLTWDSAAECQTETVRAPDRNVVMHFVIDGAFEAVQDGRTVNVKAGQVLVADSGSRTIKRWAGPCELINVAVSRAALAKLLATEFSLSVEGRLAFRDIAVLDCESVDTLAHMVATIAADLASPNALFAEPYVAASAERTLHLLLLKSLPHQYQPALASGQARIAPYYVRRAELYMRANLAKSIAMEEVVAASGVSARALFYGFRDYRNSTPMKYLKALRLRAARQAIMESRGTAARVAEIAGRFGYVSISHFSRDYKSLFGETPVETLRAC